MRKIYYNYDRLMYTIDKRTKHWSHIRYYMSAFRLGKYDYQLRITKEKLYDDMKRFTDDNAYIEVISTASKHMYIYINKVYIYVLEDYEGLWSIQNNVFKPKWHMYRPNTPQPTANRKWTHKYTKISNI